MGKSVATAGFFFLRHRSVLLHWGLVSALGVGVFILAVIKKTPYLMNTDKEGQNERHRDKRGIDIEIISSSRKNGILNYTIVKIMDFP